MRCDLSIGGLPVVILGDSEVLQAELSRRYLGYLKPGGRLLTTRVRLGDPAQGQPLVDPRAAFREGRLVFDSPGLAGEIDVPRGEAEVLIEAAQPGEALDYFLRAVWAMLAFESGGFLYHGAGILRRGQVGIFFGPSGSGKTTIARLAAGEKVLNDDLVLIMPAGEGWEVHATPFWNPSQAPPSPGARGPLGAFFRLVKDSRHALEAMRPGESLAELVASIPLLPADPSRSPAVLQRARALLDAHPAYRLHFRPEPAVWETVDPALA